MYSQILRYNVSKAYMPHYDYVPSAEAYNNHNYESNSTGSNRFATFLLYLSEVREGGETVFSSVVPKLGRLYPDYGAQSRDDLLSQFDELGLTHNLPEDGWERQLLVDCRTKLSIKPRKTSVLLFYSQHPNGTAGRKLHCAYAYMFRAARY
jgi:prolyl 4-hydroxylase